MMLKELSLIWKDSVTHMHGLAVNVKEGLPFALDLSLENYADSYLCFWLALLHFANFSISNNLTQIVNFPTRIPNCDSVSTDFPINSKQDALFHRVAYDYSHADWDGLGDHLRDVPWEGTFKLSGSPAASEFCEWVQVGFDVYIPHPKYQVKPYSSPSFSAACAAAIVHRSHFFLYQQN